MFGFVSEFLLKNIIIITDFFSEMHRPQHQQSKYRLIYIDLYSGVFSVLSSIPF